MSTTKLTLLAPAKDPSVARAAIQAGADAVYIGAPQFGARQAAGNSVEEIARLVSYAHRFGVRVLVTLNTLLTDSEIPQALTLAHQLYQAGVDALIIQDLQLLDHPLPPIRLHASTQCDNRHAEQVASLRDKGFQRVVLARELDLNQIASIHQSVPDIELEAFVHGALCVSYSGRCYMSEQLMGRSANRGCCAQMCRMRYDLLDADGNEILDDSGQPIHQRYLLSLQDMDRSLYLNELIAAGVTTFKIEGRLKDADYVTNVVAYYRRKLDALIAASNGRYESASLPFVGTLPEQDEHALQKTFHRGETDYFLHGRTPHMANWDTPKSTGEPIGEILEIRGNAMRVRLSHPCTLHPGDGLTFGDQGCNINRIDGDWLYTNKTLPTTPLPTTPLHRNLDTAYLKSLHAHRFIPVDILLRETPQGFSLRIGNQEQEFTYPHQPAQHPERALQTLHDQLTKLGDTDYIARQITLDTKPYFIPISVINLWRRELTHRS